jgi:hypothetical protein
LEDNKSWSHRNKQETSLDTQNAQRKKNLIGWCVKNEKRESNYDQFSFAAYPELKVVAIVSEEDIEEPFNDEVFATPGAVPVWMNYNITYFSEDDVDEFTRTRRAAGVRVRNQ